MHFVIVAPQTICQLHCTGRPQQTYISSRDEKRRMILVVSSGMSATSGLNSGTAKSPSSFLRNSCRAEGATTTCQLCDRSHSSQWSSLTFALLPRPTSTGLDIHTVNLFLLTLSARRSCAIAFGLLGPTAQTSILDRSFLLPLADTTTAMWSRGRFGQTGERGGLRWGYGRGGGRCGGLDERWLEVGEPCIASCRLGRGARVDRARGGGGGGAEIGHADAHGADGVHRAHCRLR